MAGGFIRLGNLFNSEIIGKVTTVPWAIIFKKVDPLPRHPTQIYEALGYFFISFLLYRIYIGYKRKPLEGKIFGLTLAMGFYLDYGLSSLKRIKRALRMR